MQLPRGTFREIQKCRKTREIFVELERSRFSGICSISCPDGICTLVFHAGKSILAEYNSAKGDAALKTLLTSVNEKEVDAALSTLDEAQIRLSLEFNKNEKVHATHPARSPEKAVHSAVPPVPPAPTVPAKSSTPSPAAGSPVHGSDVARLMARQAEKTHRPPLAGPRNPIAGPPPLIRTEKPSVQKELAEPSPQVQEKEETSFESDLDTLDSMNLDQVKSKIRDECKVMVKHLRLDHLMDKD